MAPLGSALNRLSSKCRRIETAARSQKGRAKAEAVWKSSLNYGRYGVHDHQHRLAMLDTLADLAGRYRLQAIFDSREFVEAGGLISYGASVVDKNRRTAICADKILRGAKPADLRVEQPTKFELAINLKIA